MSEPPKHNIEVGQVVYARHHQPRNHAIVSWFVKSVGKRWVVLDDGRTRFDRETLLIENSGGGNVERVWLSREDYDEEIGRARAFWKLRAALDGSASIKNFTRAQLENALRAIGLEPEAGR
jgi:hypothetical protein